MNLDLQCKRALVTGASRGLGRSIALELAREGSSVAIVARDENALSRVLAEMGGKDEGHLAIALDLMEDDAVERLAEEIAKDFGSLDIIVHNLGGTLGIREVLSGAEDYQKVWRFNLGIAIDLNQCFIPVMENNGWGRVVHISSSSAVMADASLPYSSAKAAVNTYVKGLGRVMAKKGVNINAVMPGPFFYKDSHWDKIARDDPQRYEKFINERMAVGRIGKPDEISSMVAYLCSERASFIAGAVISVDGGVY